jgi:hypothetical protein
MFWICVQIGTSFSILGSSAVIINCLYSVLYLGKPLTQHSRFVLMMVIFDGLFSVMCLALCSLNMVTEGSHLDDLCNNNEKFSPYMFVWFFYLSALMWVLALTVRSFVIIVLERKRWITKSKEILIHIIIFMAAFSVVFLPKLTVNVFFVSNGAICIWGSPAFATITFCIIALPLITCMGIMLYKISNFQGEHEKVIVATKKAHRKTMIFLVIFLVGNIGKFISIWNVIGLWFDAIVVLLLHFQGFANGLAYYWSSVLYTSPKTAGLGEKGTTKQSRLQMTNIQRSIENIES